MARRCFYGGFSQAGGSGSGDAGEAGVTLLELIIALAVALIISAGLSGAGARSEQRALYNACLQLQSDVREARQRAVLEGVSYTVYFQVDLNRYQMYKASASFKKDIDKTVYLENGVTYNDSYGFGGVTVPGQTLTFTPCGTVSGSSGSVYLKAGKFSQSVTVLPDSGRVLLKLQK